MLTARQVGADEALAIGLVDRLADGDAVTGALALAAELVTSSLPAQLAVIRVVNAAFELPPDEGLRYEAQLEQELFVDGRRRKESAPSSPSARRTSPGKSRRD